MEINKENMFEKFFDGFQAKFIESFKTLGEDEIEQALKGNCDHESGSPEMIGPYPMPSPKIYEEIVKSLKGGEA